MNKIIIALGLTLAASTGAFAQSSALDAYVPQPKTGTATLSVNDVKNDQVVYNRAGNDGSPEFKAPAGDGIDYTATASIGASDPTGALNDKIIYHRAGNDGSPTFR
jgi:hypothetical protein